MMVVKLAVLPMLLAAAASSAPRQPTAKWNVSFDDAQCLATRSYGTSEEPLHLILKAPPVGKVMQIGLLRDGKFAPATQIDATIGFDQQRPRKTNILVFSPEKSKKRLYTLNMPTGDFAQLRGAKSLVIRSSGLDQTLSVSQLDGLLKVMDRCVSDLRRVWNVSSDEGETSKLLKRAHSELGKYVKNEDYPTVALMKGASGVVRFALLIDEAGRVADCTIVETSGVAVLDAQTCAIIRTRAKFEPGVGPDGKPAKDAYVANFRWVMP